MNVDMILIYVIEKTKNEYSKSPKGSKKIIRPKNLHKVGLENLGIRCLGNLSHDGCLKTKKIRIMLDIQDLF